MLLVVGEHVLLYDTLLEEGHLAMIYTYTPSITHDLFVCNYVSYAQY